jgi:membrane protease YdiL (CAAX protease family)
MFIVSAAVPANPWAALGPSLVLAVGAAAAVLLGVFRRKSIEGPVRITPEDSMEPLAVAALCGLGLFIMLASLIHIPLRIPGAKLSKEETENIQALVPDMLARFAAVAVMVGILMTQLRHPRRLGFDIRDFLPGLWRGVLSIFVVLPLMMLALLVTESLLKLLHYQTEQVAEQLKWIGEVPDPRLRAVVIISVVIAAPLSEELFFRGCLQTWIGAVVARVLGPNASTWPRWTAVFFTSFFFAGVHLWWERLPIFVLSLCLGYAYERTGNLWVPIVIHAMFNGTSIVDFFMQGTS